MRITLKLIGRSSIERYFLLEIKVLKKYLNILNDLSLHLFDIKMKEALYICIIVLVDENYSYCAPFVYSLPILSVSIFWIQFRKDSWDNLTLTTFLLSLQVGANYIVAPKRLQENITYQENVSFSWQHVK